MNDNLIKYYKDRANEYERIYSKPERQADLVTSAKLLQDIFEARQVLEVACGTGFWTERIAQTATSVFATDINSEVIEIARKKDIGPHVQFSVADLYDLRPVERYDSLFGGFIWSHIPRQELGHFLQISHKFVKPGGLAVWMDNKFVAASNHPITHTDAEGNTFQTRQLDDRSVHKVLKNFPEEHFLREKLKNTATEINFIELTYFWILSYRTNVTGEIK
jgi:trans-aconitate methyltransferase